MDSTTAKVIEQLAKNLGTTSEYIWAVLLHQARITAITDLLLIGLNIAFAALLYILHKRFKRQANLNRLRTYGELTSTCMAISVGVSLVGTMCCLSLIPEIVNALFNPEYWALSEIMRKLK